MPKHTGRLVGRQEKHSVNQRLWEGSAEETQTRKKPAANLRLYDMQPMRQLVCLQRPLAETGAA